MDAERRRSPSSSPTWLALRRSRNGRRGSRLYPDAQPVEAYGEAVREQGRIVQGFTGDGIMAVFGAPVAFEDAPSSCRTSRPTGSIPIWRVGSFVCPASPVW